jgi:hypothetical protein
MRGNEGRGVEKILERSDEGHRVVGRKAQFFEWQELSKGKLLQLSGCKERTPVEHSRETFLATSSANFNTTSAGDQDEF